MRRNTFATVCRGSSNQNKAHVRGGSDVYMYISIQSYMNWQNMENDLECKSDEIQDFNEKSRSLTGTRVANKKSVHIFV